MQTIYTTEQIYPGSSRRAPPFDRFEEVESDGEYDRDQIPRAAQYPELIGQPIQDPFRPYGEKIPAGAPNGPKVVDEAQRRRLKIYENPLYQFMELVATCASVDPESLWSQGTTKSSDETHLISAAQGAQQISRAPFGAATDAAGVRTLQATTPFDPDTDPHTLIKQYLFSAEKEINRSTVELFKLLFDGNHSYDRSFMEHVENSGRLFYSAQFRGAIRLALKELRTDISGGEKIYAAMSLILSHQSDVVTAFAELVACEIKSKKVVSATRALPLHTSRDIQREHQRAKNFFVDVKWDSHTKDYSIVDAKKAKRCKVVAGLVPYEASKLY